MPVTWPASNITDHIIKNPTMLTIQAIQGISKIGESSAGANRVLTTFETLTLLMENKLPATVVTGLKVYEDMAITDLKVNRNAKNGQALPLQFQMTQITIVQSQTAIIPKSQLTGDSSTQQQSQPEQDVGDTQSGQTQTTEDDNFMDQIEADVDAIFAGLGF